MVVDSVLELRRVVALRLLIVVLVVVAVVGTLTIPLARLLFMQGKHSLAVISVARRVGVLVVEVAQVALVVQALARLVATVALGFPTL